MKTRVLMFVALMSVSTIIVAQPSNNGQKKPMRGQGHEMQMDAGHGGMAKGLNLTDAQKDAFKQGMIALHKELQPLRGQLGEAQAHQKTLTSAENPDITAIDKNIEKIGGLKIEMAKIMAKHRLEMRAQLSEEQRLKFDMMKGKAMKGKAHRGMGQGMGMDMPEDNPMN